MTDIVNEALEDMQNKFANLSYEGRQTVFAGDKYHKLANDLSEQEKESMGAIELVVHEYENRANYVLAFMIMFPDYYKKHRGYYDELIKYWGGQ